VNAAAKQNLPAWPPLPRALAAGFWPATVWFPVEMWLRTRQPPPRTRRWPRALSGASLAVSLAAVVGSVQQVVEGWTNFDLFSGGR
jgi:hypothetical protein